MVASKLLVQLLVLLSAFCGAVVETLIKKAVTMTGSPVTAPFHPLSAGVVAVAALDFIVLSTLFHKGYGLVEVGILQVVYYYVGLIVLGRLVYGEAISLVQTAGMALAFLSIIMMTWNQWSWAK